MSILTAPVALLSASVAGSLDPVPTSAEVRPGYVYALLFLGLVVATVLLWLNMRRQLRKIRFDQPGEDAADGGEGTGARPGGAAARDPRGPRR
jgi:hypothetical protein